MSIKGPFVAKLWTGEIRDQKIIVKFSDHYNGSTDKSYVGFRFEPEGKEMIIYFSYNTLYQMYKTTLMNKIVKKMR